MARLATKRPRDKLRPRGRVPPFPARDRGKAKLASDQSNVDAVSMARIKSHRAPKGKHKGIVGSVSGIVMAESLTKPHPLGLMYLMLLS
jgi:hypothetical protein